MELQIYQLVAGDWIGLERILNDLTGRVVGQTMGPSSSPTFAGLKLTGLSGVLQATTGVLSGSAVHDSLGSLQGGTTGEHYHLTSAEYTALSSSIVSEEDPVFTAWLAATPPLFAESDTLSIVTGRGANTTTSCQFQGALAIELGLDAATNVAGAIKFWSAGANNFYSTFTAATQGANATYTLPTAMPSSSSKFLQCTTGGILSWETVSITESDPVAMAYLNQSVKTDSAPEFAGLTVWRYGLGINTVGPNARVHILEDGSGHIPLTLVIETTDPTFNAVAGFKDGTDEQERILAFNFINNADDAVGQFAFFNSPTAGNRYMRFYVNSNVGFKIDGDGKVCFPLNCRVGSEVAPTVPLDVTGAILGSSTIEATTGFKCGGTAAVADGTYTVGARLTPVTGTDGTITVKGGIITAITAAT